MTAERRVLVSGVNGFVGRFMVRHLLRRRLTVWGIGRSPSPPFSHPRFHYDICDVRDREGVLECLRQQTVDYVIHLAAQTDVRQSRADPAEVLKTNCMGTVYLLEAIRQTQRDRVKGILVAGSSHEYDMRRGGDLSEETPLSPVSPYGWSKLMTTSVAKMYAEVYHLPILIARTFNVIGPGASAGVCADLVRQVVEIEQGRRAPRLMVGNQDVERDFVDVRDVVAAYWLLLTGKPVQPGEVYNVASGTSRSIGRMVEILRQHAHRTFEVVTDEALVRPGEPTMVRGDIRKLQSIGWAPQRTFEQSVADALRHARREQRKEVHGS